MTESVTESMTEICDWIYDQICDRIFLVTDSVINSDQIFQSLISVSIKQFSSSVYSLWSGKV